MFHISSCLTVFAYITYLNITGHAPPPACGRERVKNFRKVFAGGGGRYFYFGGGGVTLLGVGSCNFEVKIKTA